MTTDTAGSLAIRLNYVRENMQAVLDAFDTPLPPDMRTMTVNTERWIMSLDSIIAQAVDAASLGRFNELLAQALAGSDIAASARCLDLHKLSQLSAALRPGCTMTVFGGDGLSPIEQASITTASNGSIRFIG